MDMFERHAALLHLDAMKSLLNGEPVLVNRAVIGRRFEGAPVSELHPEPVEAYLRTARHASLGLHLAAVQVLIAEEEGYGIGRMDMIERFATQIIDVYDPDAVSTFLDLRDNANIDTLLTTAVRLDRDAMTVLLDLVTYMASNRHRGEAEELKQALAS